MKNIPFFKIFFLVLFILLSICIFLFREYIPYFEIFTDKELLKLKVQSFGLLGPFFYIFVQMLQVIIAPVPGEVTGLVGGYLFGAYKGFAFSTIALTAGSVLNFFVGRFVGKEAVKRIIPSDYYFKFDKFFKEEGRIFILALFLFPGFPKDFFCLFLGVTNLDLKTFFLFAFLGRMPGTLLLSIQGEFLYQGDYILTLVLASVVGVISCLLIYYRKQIYLMFKNNEKQ
ncbi:MAG: TVP38/TMEM64 family protein [Thermodesulfobacteriota bacterium]